jgi:hypothetical protein
MAAKPNVALRVLSIVLISGVIVLASALFLLLAACGALTASSSDRWISVVIVAVYGVILIGGFYSIFKLARGIMRAPQPSVVAEVAVTPRPAASPAEDRKLLEPLRLAMAASIGLSFLAIVAFRFQARDAGAGMPMSMLPFFVLYQVPFLIAFWLTREGPERKGIGLAMTFSAVSTLHGLWSWGSLLLMYSRMGTGGGMQPSTLISLADIVATGAAAFLALQLWRRGPETRDDIVILVCGVLGSIFFLAIVQGLQHFVIMRGLGG